MTEFPVYYAAAGIFYAMLAVGIWRFKYGHPASGFLLMTTAMLGLIGLQHLAHS